MVETTHQSTETLWVGNIEPSLDKNSLISFFVSYQLVIFKQLRLQNKKNAT